MEEQNRSCQLTIKTLILLHFIVAIQSLLRFQNVAISSAQNKTYLILNNISRYITDAETVTSLGMDPTLISASTLQEFESKSLQKGDPVPLISFKKNTPDDIMQAYMLRSSLFNGNIFTDFELIGDYINPSIGKFRNRLLLVTALQMGLSGRNKKKQTNKIEFCWVNTSRYPIYNTGSYLGIENEIESLDVRLDGQDPRMVIYNDSYIQIYFTSTLIYGLDFQYMGTAEVKLLEKEQRMSITYEHQPIWPQTGFHISGRHQKNWSPFIYSGDTYLIQALRPFTVVHIKHYGTQFQKNATIISQWRYHYHSDVKGELRGGTNAILINDKYLAFYHIRTKLSKSYMSSYLFGAYTFSAQRPFRMLRMSPTPIMPEKLYTGKWASKFIDYCVYPMHIFLEDNETLLMSFGYQDKFGMIGRLHLPSLLQSLVPVDS